MTKRAEYTQFSRFFSLDSTKAIKAREYGYLNGINYMAPSTLAGVGNVCPDASPACLALCLGWFSGQAGMVKGNRRDALNMPRRSRIAKVRLFMHDRAAFMVQMVKGVERALRKATTLGLKLCIRPNGSSDIPWEHIHLSHTDRRTIFDLYPHVQFVDYTKSVKRMLRWCEGKLPRNYHLTFSRSEINEADCERVLAAGGTVAAVFETKPSETWRGWRVIDGDKHDLRHLDPQGVVIALSPKSVKARRDRKGFVIRAAA